MSHHNNLLNSDRRLLARSRTQQIYTQLHEENNQWGSMISHRMLLFLFRRLVVFIVRLFVHRMLLFLLLFLSRQLLVFVVRVFAHRMLLFLLLFLFRRLLVFVVRLFHRQPAASIWCEDNGNLHTNKFESQIQPLQFILTL